MGTIIGYILLTLMLAFTLFNIYATATKKKRDAVNEAKYNALFAPIDQEILKLGKDWKGSPTMRLITEKEEGIVCVRDDGRKRAVIAWDGGLRVFRFNEFNGAELEDNEEGVRILVHLEDETLTLQASMGKFKKKSFIVKSITEMAKSFVNFLNVITEKKNEVVSQVEASSATSEN